MRSRKKAEISYDALLSNPPMSGKPTPTRAQVIEALHGVIDDLESGKLQAGGWRERYVASAIGLLASGCHEAAGAHAEQARTSHAIHTPTATAKELRRGLEAISTPSATRRE